jgi:hypothetical protein
MRVTLAELEALKGIARRNDMLPGTLRAQWRLFADG